MNLYTHDLSLFDFSLSDHIIDSLSRSSSFSPFPSEPPDRSLLPNRRPPKHRHDGTSPLPLGMDWSPPPRQWDGQDSVWPHDPHTGWSYCVVIPSWIILPKSSGSDSVVFYRVQIGIQSPEGITTTRTILRRFNDFLKLFSELKEAFPQKNLPSAPSKKLLRVKTSTLLEERRSSLEDWMEKLLSDIDLSRSAPVAIFLELEAAARSSFDDIHRNSDVTSSASGVVPSFQFQPKSDVSVVAGSSSIASDYGYDSTYEKSDVGTPRHARDNFSELGMDNLTADQNLSAAIDTNLKFGMYNNDNGLLIGDSVTEKIGRLSRHKLQIRKENNVIGNNKVSESTSKAVVQLGDEMEPFSEVKNSKVADHVRRLSAESVVSDISSVRASEISNLGMVNSFGDGSIDFPEGSEAPRTMDSLASSGDPIVVLPSDERRKMNRVLITLQRRLATAKTDMEDLIARLNQELAVRQYLTTKVKDLEVELETTKHNCKDNLQQAILIERERFTQMQWDMEELRRKCLDMEMKLKSEQEERLHTESVKVSVIQKNEMLLHELDVAREQLLNLQKQHEELEIKSKADVKVLVKEVKSLRSSHSELKQELGRVMKEKIEVERVLQKEKKRREIVDAANAKLLHECEILQNRLKECSVNFLVEEEDKLIMDASSPFDAVDLLTTSDNRIGLLLAEAQLLAQDVESSITAADRSQAIAGDDARTTDDQLRKMLTDIFIDNATLRKQINSVIRCALHTPAMSEKDDEEDEIPLKKTVLSKFLEH
ncbi:LOW QUALITY PROTEIN: PX domain-containing protein EREX [Malania oleifera]|uniref:LOW QUALITY PROTEIN: PX domain-containing protein EREX n=1 Tax=Malania oleifera TaxID=397392 RepID=UPI0025AE0C6F|nr:LOW QUALITY PROTEIN: PX domain-containing protein EREX [Malania oleifera]